MATDSDLAAYQPRLALLNPAHVKYFRKALPEQDKTDITDPHLIDRYYRVSGVKHPHTFNPRYLPLRQLSRAYCRLTHTLAAEKALCLSLLYLTASEYQRLKPFSNNLGATGRHILTEYPDIAAIADIPLDDLAPLLQKHAHGRLTDPRENATKLHQVVQDSYPLAEELVPAVQIVLAQTRAHLDFLEQQKKTYRQHLTAALDVLPEAKPALAISGLGPALVAGCLAEIQSLR